MPSLGQTCLLWTSLAAGLALPQAAGELQRFASHSGSFQIDLPACWRQLAPNEALRIADIPASPRDLQHAEPRLQYAVGPVDAWLQGDFAGCWLYVTEIAEEAVLPPDFAERLPQLWQAHGQANGLVHELRDIASDTLGSLAHPVRTAVRRSTAVDGSSDQTSLDAYVATGRRQLTLAFTCRSSEFDQFAPQFRAWLATAAFARPARGETTLSDRLWTPLWMGAAVSLVLLLLYKHARSRR